MKTKLLTLAGGLVALSLFIILSVFAEQGLNAQGSADSKTVDAKSNAGKACANGACPTFGWKDSKNQYSEVEQKLINHFCDRIAETGQAQFDLDEVSKAIGIPVTVLEGMAIGKLQPAVLSELSRRKVELSSVIGNGCGNCSRFSACSVDRDLSGATGEELVRYEKEKSQDGMTFADFSAPDFTLPTTDGKQVALSDYRGRPVVVTFLSGHCSHSFDMLPILAKLKKKYEPLGITVLPVYINSGSVENILTWSSEMKLGYPFLVSSTKELSKAYDSRMVPATFLIDEKGQVRQKFVGYKSETELDVAFANLISDNFETAKL